MGSLPMDPLTQLPIADYTWLPPALQATYQNLLELDDGVALIHFISEVEMVGPEAHMYYQDKHIELSSLEDVVPSRVHVAPVVVMMSSDAIYFCTSGGGIVRWVEVEAVDAVLLCDEFICLCIRCEPPYDAAFSLVSRSSTKDAASVVGYASHQRQGVPQSQQAFLSILNGARRSRDLSPILPVVIDSYYALASRPLGMPEGYTRNSAGAPPPIPFLPYEELRTKVVHANSLIDVLSFSHRLKCPRIESWELKGNPLTTSPPSATEVVKLPLERRGRSPTQQQRGAAAFHPTSPQAHRRERLHAILSTDERREGDGDSRRTLSRGSPKRNSSPRAPPHVVRTLSPDPVVIVMDDNERDGEGGGQDINPSEGTTTKVEGGTPRFMRSTCSAIARVASKRPPVTTEPAEPSTEVKPRTLKRQTQRPRPTTPTPATNLAETLKVASPRFDDGSLRKKSAAEDMDHHHKQDDTSLVRLLEELHAQRNSLDTLTRHVEQLVFQTTSSSSPLRRAISSPSSKATPAAGRSPAKVKTGIDIAHMTAYQRHLLIDPLRNPHTEIISKKKAVKRNGDTIVPPQRESATHRVSAMVREFVAGERTLSLPRRAGSSMARRRHADPTQ